MKDVMVSIRMPRDLIEELKKISRREHYMDLSETVRSFVRQKWMAAKDPVLYEIKKLRNEIYQEIRKKSLRYSRQQVVEELKRIKERLKE